MNASIQIEFRRLFTIGLIAASLAFATMVSAIALQQSSTPLADHLPALADTTQDGTGGG